MIYILSQAAQVAPNAAQEMASHPGLNWWLFGVALTLLGILLKLLLRAMESRANEKFAAIESHNSRQDEKLEAMEYDLRKYETNVAVGAKESAEIHAAITRMEAAFAAHLLKEEGTTWVKIDTLVSCTNDMKLSNEVAHAELTAGQVLLGQRVDAMEKKMPNGELSQLAEAFSKLARARKPTISKGQVRGKK